MTDTIQFENTISYQPTDAEWIIFKKWEGWLLGLRSYVHTIVNEELSGADLLNDFFDAYGLAFAAHYEDDAMAAMALSAPTTPTGNPFHLYRSPTDMMERVEAAARGKPMSYPKEDMGTVAVALRERAEALSKLADQIDSGEFHFPK